MMLFYLENCTRACSIVNGWGKQPEIERSTRIIWFKLPRFSWPVKKSPPEMPHAPGHPLLPPALTEQLQHIILKFLLEIQTVQDYTEANVEKRCA